MTPDTVSASARPRRPADRFAVGEAVVLLPMIAVSLRLQGMRRTQAILHRFAGRHEAAPSGSDPERAERLADAVITAASTGPYRPSCLRRALALETLLHQRGLDAELKLGVRRARGELGAHAWVEHCGIALGVETDHETYATFPPPPSVTGRM